jgi:hypothetical protein
MTPDRASRLRELKAARARRYRQRVGRSVACVQVEIDGELLSLLIRLHWLKESEASNAVSVGRALTEMLKSISAK